MGLSLLFRITPLSVKDKHLSLYCWFVSFATGKVLCSYKLPSSQVLGI